MSGGLGVIIGLGGEADGIDKVVGGETNGLYVMRRDSSTLDTELHVVGVRV